MKAKIDVKVLADATEQNIDWTKYVEPEKPMRKRGPVHYKDDLLKNEDYDFQSIVDIGEGNDEDDFDEIDYLFDERKK